MKPISHIKANQEYRSMLHFTGVKKGDVNFSASIRSRDRKNLSREELVFGEPELFNGFIRIPVNMSSAETVKSMQFSLKNNNKTAWLAVEPGRLNIQLDDYTMDEHELSLVWIANGHQPDRLSKADFYLVFDNIHSEDVDREKIDLSLKLTPEIFNGQELKENIRLNTVHSAGTFEVSSAYPNPFAHTVRFNLTGTTGKLIVTEVYDLSGKQIYRQIIGQEVTEYTLDGSLLPAPGFYTIRFILDAGVVNRKLYYLP